MPETLATLADTGNIAETLARELKRPEIHAAQDVSALSMVLLPPGWTHQSVDVEKLLPTPRRKVASVVLTDADSYIAYIKRHGSLVDATLWCKADFTNGALSFTAILNDHGEEEDQPAWRDHKAAFTPEKSVEWATWTGKNAAPMSQVDFAVFLEENLKDVIKASGMPSGNDILAMATGFEARQDMRFKSAVRLQSGGIRMEYVADDDRGTAETMQVFERFQIAIPVLRDDKERYPITARLRYRQRDGKLAFWYELIRPDLVMEVSARALVESIRSGAGVPFFFGSPFAQ